MIPTFKILAFVLHKWLYQVFVVLFPGNILSKYSGLNELSLYLSRFFLLIFVLFPQFNVQVLWEGEEHGQPNKQKPLQISGARQFS